MSDEELYKAFEKAKTGDEEAFGLIYDYFAEKILRFIYFRTGHKEVAEDILSDTFVKAWTKLSQVNSHKALSTWLYQIAKNNVIDYYRVRKNLVPIDEVAAFLEDAAPAIDDSLLGFRDQKLLAMVENLPQEQREVIRYKFFEDLTNQEIALLMNKTEGAIRVIQHRAVVKLREMIKPDKPEKTKGKHHHDE